MSMKSKWNELLTKMETDETNELRELVLLIDEVSKEPTEEGYEKVVKKLNEDEPVIKDLPAKMYVEMDKLVKGQIANIYDKVLKTLEQKENIRKKTRWELFIEEAKRKNWTPILELISFIEEKEEGTVTEQIVEEIQAKIKNVSAYINENLSPYESDWADKEFKKKIRILSNKVDRVVTEGFGDYLRELRKSKGLSLKDLENRTEVTASYIHRLEHGSRKTPSIPVAERLARGLDVPVKEFLSKLKLFEGESSDDNKDVMLGLPELIILNTFTINGKKASKKQKEAMVDVVTEILSSSWTSETMIDDQHKIIQLIDTFKKCK